MWSARVWAVLVLAWPVGYQVAQSIESARVYNNGPEAPFAVGVESKKLSRLTKAAEAAGLQKDDVLLALDGRPVTLPADLYAYLRTVKAGTRMAVTYRRAGGEARQAAVALAPAYDLKSWQDWVLGLFADFITRWVSLALGCFVVLMRPKDPLAWLVLLLMISFGQLATGTAQVAEGWVQPWRSLGTSYRLLANLTWPVWMLLFGLYFPDRHSKVRLLDWSKWVVGLPILLFSLVVAALDGREKAGQAFPEWILPALGVTNKFLIYFIIAACGLFFANIRYKMSREPAADARRRLGLLFWGTNAGITPLFLLVLYGLATKQNLGEMPPVVLVPAIAALLLFPVTLGYVIVVERAMDVRVVVRQGLQHALAQRAVRVVTALLMLVVMWVAFESLSRSEMRRAVRLQVIAYSMLAAILVQRVAGRVRAWIDRKFFREQVEAEKMLVALSEEVRRISDAEELKQRVAERVSAAMHVERVEIGEGPGEGWELAVPLSPGTEYLRLGAKKSEEPYSKGDQRLLETVAAQTALALENARLTRAVAEEAARRERIHRELEIAREVQERLFPHNPPGVAGLDYTGVCKPAQSIGGDYYDFFLSADGRLTLAVGDICGKGVPAALLMAGLQASLRGLCAGGVEDLGELMTRLNRLVFEATPKNRFATLWCGQYDPGSRVLRYVSAGHGDAVVLRAGGGMDRTSNRGLALGLVRQAQYGYGEVSLGSGDLVAVCTDGVTEAMSAGGEEFREQRWWAVLEEARGMAASAAVGLVMARVEEFAKGAEQHDDITIVAARVL
ncbi:MAG: SpoIIE family protein phosphatase [Acidobacteria bacterium]|nr:SpoIIE family protein phosphatase [Acidobacteriota bacterium]